MATTESSDSRTKKKRKTCESFNRERLLAHKEGIEKGFDRLNRYEFCFLKVLHCNGDQPTPFSRAWCRTTRNIDVDDDGFEEEATTANFDEVFNTTPLRRVLNGPVDVEEWEIVALRRLEVFLDDMEGRDFNKLFKHSLNEVQLAGVLGTHILKPLSVDQNMVISDSGYTYKPTTCVCGCQESLRYGDASFGNVEVWHGSVDIIIGPAAVQIVDETEDTEEVNSLVEVNHGFDMHRSQLIAKSIVFAFTQKRPLAPLIVLSHERAKLFLYDPEGDLLFEGMATALFKVKKRKKILHYSAIILIWMALNYKIFGKGVMPRHLKEINKCGFIKFIEDWEDVKQIYEEELNFGNCRRGPSRIVEYNHIK